jgi:Mg-chelatase subunit ChlD
MALRSFNSSAAYYKSLTSFQGKGGLSYHYSDYKIPVSLLQKSVSESGSVPNVYAKSLNLQSEVMVRIMKEMEALSEALERETNDKRYEKDHLAKVYEILERYRVLFETLDVKKEILFNDVRMVYDSYPAKNPESNWIISWRALRSLTDFDHKALFQAKEFYKGTSTDLPSTSDIDSRLREVIANEYDNMKGIEKFGRNNGLCPYTPYEDIPHTSRTFSEKLKKISPVKEGYTRHPYHDLVYLYNEVADDYNKFCELSKLGLLKTVKQPEWFEVDYPEKKTNSTSVEQQASVMAVGATQVNNSQQNSPNKSPDTGVKVVHDTVYIERHDTVYLADPGENIRSMHGYATNNMVLLLDVSGSMNSPEKLPLLKTSVLNLLDMMRQEDQVSIVVYSGKAKVLLQPTSFMDKEKIRQAINSLTSSGQTDGNAGIKLAYQVADRNYIRGGNNRIILATDGEFPISEDVFNTAEKFSKEDIFVTVFNFGKTTASAKNLEKLSRKGKGNYERITKENMELKLIKEVKAKKAK